MAIGSRRLCVVAVGWLALVCVSVEGWLWSNQESDIAPLSECERNKLGKKCKELQAAKEGEKLAKHTPQAYEQVAAEHAHKAEIEKAEAEKLNKVAKKIAEEEKRKIDQQKEEEKRSNEKKNAEEEASYTSSAKKIEAAAAASSASAQKSAQKAADSNKKTEDAKSTAAADAAKAKNESDEFAKAVKDAANEEKRTSQDESSRKGAIAEGMSRRSREVSKKAAQANIAATASFAAAKKAEEAEKAVKSSTDLGQKASYADAAAKAAVAAENMAETAEAAAQATVKMATTPLTPLDVPAATSYGGDTAADKERARKQKLEEEKQLSSKKEEEGQNHKKEEEERNRKKEEEARKNEEEMQHRQQALEAEHKLKTNGEYLLSLKNIFFSFGTLEPQFASDVFKYTLRLKSPHDQLAITPEIYKDRTEYAGGEQNLPLIELMWGEGKEDIATQNAIFEKVAVAIRRQIDLPDDGSDLAVTIRVRNPHNDSAYVDYFINVKQSSSVLLALKTLQIKDASGDIVQVNPIPSRETVTYTAYISPDSPYLVIKPNCVSPWVAINGRTVTDNEPFTVLRELKRHVQLIQITCGQGSVYWSDDTSNLNYFVKVISDYTLEQIPMPRLVVENLGKECGMLKDSYSCPDPVNKQLATQLFGEIEPRIRYTIESPDKAVEIRLLNQIPSIPFSYRSDLIIKAVSGRFSKEWPLVFNVPSAISFLQLIGMIVGLSLAVLLASQVVILVISSLLAVGLPVVLTEIASILALTIQYMCYSNTSLEKSFFASTVKYFKWFTLFIPLPWVDENHIIGDVTDLANAYGCIFWCAAILFATTVAHGIAAAKIVLCEKNYTFPHCLRFGGVESRVMSYLIFPLATASSICLFNSDAEAMWRGLAFISLSSVIVWAVTSWVYLKNLVKGHNVVWVWNTSSSEGGDLADISGYWADTVCDQLNTQPSSRSTYPCIDWQWSSTVADVHSVNIAPELFNRHSEYGMASDSNSSARESLRSSTATSPDASPIGKSPKTIEIIKARSPGMLCPGQRLFVGLLRTQWLETIMTFRSITLLNDRLSKDELDKTTIPLIVKTNQLQGPLTTGGFSFFFEGVKVPFVKIWDSVARLLLAVCVGFALVSTDQHVKGIVFSFITALTLCTICYFAATCPYSRGKENVLYIMAMTTIAVSSMFFSYVALTNRDISSIRDGFLGFGIFAAFVMALYSIIISLSLYASVVCPTLPESKFIENLSNCTIAITDHESQSKTVEVPGWTKYPPKNVKVYCSQPTKGVALNTTLFATGEEPTLEFSYDDMITAFKTGSLKAPVLCLYVPSASDPLKYGHYKIYDKYHCEKEITKILTAEHSTRAISADVSKAIMRQLSALNGKNIMVITVLHPKNANARNDYISSSNSTGTNSTITESRSKSSKTSTGSPNSSTSTGRAAY